MGKTGSTTRAGHEGSYDTYVLQGGSYGDATLTGWNETNAKAQGFGVFAYSTGTDTYDDYRGLEVANKEPNFMFNQLVWYNNTLSRWDYSPIKYWPNEVGAGHVDDQNSDTSNDPATTAGNNGGNVSFFAYAPYVEVATKSNAATIDGFLPSTTTDGIVAISGNAYVGVNGGGTAANNRYSDPYVKYIIPTDKTVDLLWGTAGKNGVNVIGKANSGVSATSPVVEGTTNDPFVTTGYANNILKEQTTNADLTKMTTNGKIEFKFKHALAKIGGSYVGSNPDGSDDENATTPTNGLMVILDIDKDGEETGGALEKYSGSSSTIEGTPYNTKVTINAIYLKVEKQAKDGVSKTDYENYLKTVPFDYTSTTYFETIKNQGILNLATGQWTDIESTGTPEFTQLVEGTGVAANEHFNPTTNDFDGSTAGTATISDKLAEPSTPPTYTQSGFESLPIGVTTVAKNVYKGDAQPFVFIPGTRPVIEVTIVYTVRTYDANLNRNFTEVKQLITKRLYLTEPVELNKQYNILMRLGLTSVKFTATVSDWDVTDIDGTSSTTSPTDGTSPVQTITEDVKHVYLPINVKDATTVAATFKANGTAGNVDITGSPYKIASAEVDGALQLDNGTTNYVTADGQKVDIKHVLLTSNADWITCTYADNSTPSTADDIWTVDIDENTTTGSRTGTLYVTYDNKTTEYVITQVAPAVSEITALTFTPALGTSDAAPAKGGTYTSQITYNIQHKQADGTSDHTGTKTGLTTSIGYTLGDGTTAPTAGQTYEGTKLVIAPIENSITAKTVSVKATVDAVSSPDVTATQTAPVVSSIVFNDFAPTALASTTGAETALYTVTASLTDATDETAYLGTFNVTTTSMAVTVSDDTNFEVSDGKVKTKTANTGIAKRTTTATATYSGTVSSGGSGTTSKEINQEPGALQLSFSPKGESGTPVATNTDTAGDRTITLTVKDAGNNTTGIVMNDATSSVAIVNGSSWTVNKKADNTVEIVVPKNTSGNFTVNVKVGDATGSTTLYTSNVAP